MFVQPREHLRFIHTSISRSTFPSPNSIFSLICVYEPTPSTANNSQLVTTTLLRLTVTRLSIHSLAAHPLTTAHGPLSIAPKQHPCSTFSVQTRGEGRPCYQQMLSIAIENRLDCRSVTPVNNAVSATRGGGGQCADEPPKARVATRASERREKGERVEDEWIFSMQTLFVVK